MRSRHAWGVPREGRTGIRTDGRAGSALAVAGRRAFLTGLVVAGFALPGLAAPLSAQVSDSLAISRLRYDGGGDWYANPSALANLLAAIRDRTGIPTTAREAVVSALDPGLRDHPHLYMTGHGEVRFSRQERAALRAHLLDGGFLHVDDNYGLDESFRREVAALFPERTLVEIPPDHQVFHQLYDFDEGLPKIHEHDGERPQGLGIFVDGRLVLFYSYESDLGDGWEDPEVHDDAPALREAALRMGVNLFLYALAGAGAVGT